MYLCRMRRRRSSKPKTDATPKTEADIFREKVPSYLVCFIDTCPLHEQCLRWLVGCHADTAPLSHVAVNPRNPKMGREDCPMYREKKRVVMKRGLTQMYHEMPGYMEHDIRHALIHLFTRKAYFQMRRGDRLITPAEQQQIADTCRRHGWTAPIVYDAEEEAYYW